MDLYFTETTRLVCWTMGTILMARLLFITPKDSPVRWAVVAAFVASGGILGLLVGAAVS